jgi:tetratricopeptide (TPR) repeat protein
MDQEYEEIARKLADPQLSLEERQQAIKKMEEIVEKMNKDFRSQTEALGIPVTEEEPRPKKPKRQREEDPEMAAFEQEMKEKMEAMSERMRASGGQASAEMNDPSKMMAEMGMPDISKMMAGMGMPDMSNMMAGTGMPDMSKMMGGMGMPDMPPSESIPTPDHEKSAAVADTKEEIDAEERVRQAISLDSNNADLYFELAMILFEKGDDEGAQKAMDESSRIRNAQP